MPRSSQTLTAFGDRVGQLYSLPAVALRVMELTDEPDIDVPELKATVETDPALTAKILRVVNSSLFSRVGDVADLTQALALLGTQPLKLLVLGFSLPSELFEGQDSDILSRYWRRSLTKAVAARELGHRFWHVAGDEAFIAGLLDDLGQLVLLQQLKQRYVDFLKRVEIDSANLEQLETETLGFNHRQLSGEILRRWNLPESILQGIKSPREVDKLVALSAEVAQMPRTMHLAELVADTLTQRDEHNIDLLVAAAKTYRNIPSKDIVGLLDEVERLVGQLAMAMGADIGDDVDYRDIVTAAHARLAAVAEGTVRDVVGYRRIVRDRDVEEIVSDEATALAECLSTMLQWKLPSKDSQPDLSSTAQAQSTDGPTNTGDRQMAAVFRQGELSANRSQEAPGNCQVASVASPACRDTCMESLNAHVASAVALCRAKQWPLTVILFEMTSDAGSSSWSRQEAEALAGVVAACRTAQVQYAQVCPVDATRLGWILPNSDRTLAVELTREVLACVQSETHHSDAAWILGAGVASVSAPSKNFDARTLTESAERCLYAVVSSGGSGVKSIAVF